MKLVYYLKVIVLIAILAGVEEVSAQSAVLSLEDCRAMALQNNNKIKAAQLKVDASKSSNDAAKLSSLPSLDASLTAGHFGNPLSTLVPSELLNLGLDAKQTIYAGGKVRYSKDISQKSVELSQSQKVLTQTEVLLSVEIGYWRIVQAKEKIILSDKYKKMLEGLKKEFKNSVDAGLTYKNDLLRSEVNLNQAELNSIRAADELVICKLNLAQLIGQPGNTDFAVTDEVNGSFASLDLLSPDTAADNRPEIAIMKKSIEMEQVQSKMIRADLMPQIGLSVSALGSYGKGVNFSNGDNTLGSYYSLLTVNVPVFDWGKNAKKVKEQNLKIESAKAELEENKQLIQIEAQNAYLLLNQSYRKIGLAAASLGQAEENLRLANDRLKAGTIIGKDVLEAQAIWQDAYTSSIDAKVEYNVNMVYYKKATGELK